jgi:hypothetical protein
MGWMEVGGAGRGEGERERIGDGGAFIRGGIEFFRRSTGPAARACACEFALHRFGPSCSVRSTVQEIRTLDLWVKKIGQLLINHPQQTVLVQSPLVDTVAPLLSHNDATTQCASDPRTGIAELSLASKMNLQFKQGPVSHSFHRIG